MIRAGYLLTKEGGSIATTNDDWKSLAHLINSEYIEVVRLLSNPSIVAIIDENGLGFNKPVRALDQDRFLVGDIFFLSHDPTNRQDYWSNITPEQVAFIRERCVTMVGEDGEESCVMFGGI